jgi:hypothetical protein
MLLPAPAMQSAIDSSVPSPPSTTTMSTVSTSSSFSATRQPSTDGISAAVADSKMASIPRARSHAPISTRCGVAARRWDLATMPTRERFGDEVIGRYPSTMNRRVRRV